MPSISGIGRLLKDVVVNTLTTNNKTIPGAINELDEKSTDYIKVYSVQVKYTCAANTGVTVTVDFESSLPSGYKYLGAYCRYSGSNACYCYNSSKNGIQMRNVSSVAVNATAGFDVICVKS